MAEKKSGKKKGKGGGWKNSAAAMSFDFGANVKSTGKKGGKRKPAGGGSV